MAIYLTSQMKSAILVPITYGGDLKTKCCNVGLVHFYVLYIMFK